MVFINVDEHMIEIHVVCELNKKCIIDKFMNDIDKLQETIHTEFNYNKQKKTKTQKNTLLG